MPAADDLYEVVADDVPKLAGAVLLHHLDGFVDAGAAGAQVAEHLLDRLEHRVLARFDLDRLIDYRARRPPMLYISDHWERYEAPELVVHLLSDLAGAPCLLLTGPEPDHQWELFIAAVRELTERWGLRLAVGFHGIPMGAPHTRPLRVTGHGTRPDLVGAFTPIASRLQVPASASALLELRLGQAGRDAIGFAAHVPHYLAQATYPAAAVVLLEAIVRVTGLSVSDDALREAARRADVEIERQLTESPDIADVVRALEQQYDTFGSAAGRRSLLADDAEPVPTADELGAQFERFLAEQRGDEPTDR